MTQNDRSALLHEAVSKRILLLDGATGTMIQRHELDEADYRGERFKDYASDLKGNNDLLVLTQPEIIRSIHDGYFEAGSDIVETNSFNGTSISLSDYGMAELAREINVAAATLAREAADHWSAKTPEKPRFAAGAIGPTNRTASISPDVGDPGYRNVTFDELVEAYTEQVGGLIEGGVDLLLVETIFDTLNAKAAGYAILQFFEESGVELPVIVSGTITDLSGRNLSGQTPEAFWNSMAHLEPFAIGMNCAFGAEQLRPAVAELAALANTLVCAYPNAGLPNEMGEYDQSPEGMADLLGEWAASGLVNIIGGCCGSTPDHIRALAERVASHPPRQISESEPAMRLSGLEPFTLA